MYVLYSNIGDSFCDIYPTFSYACISIDHQVSFDCRVYYPHRDIVGMPIIYPLIYLNIIIAMLKNDTSDVFYAVQALEGPVAAGPSFIFFSGIFPFR